VWHGTSRSKRQATGSKVFLTFEPKRPAAAEGNAWLSSEKTKAVAKVGCFDDGDAPRLDDLVDPLGRVGVFDRDSH
jgi:hypothetical protein